MMPADFARDFDVFSPEVPPSASHPSSRSCCRSLSSCRGSAVRWTGSPFVIPDYVAHCAEGAYFSGGARLMLLFFYRGRSYASAVVFLSPAGDTAIPVGICFVPDCFVGLMHHF